ncbi:hypothetical protein EDD11_008178 [Mortierella claussenii]|nr:hypothetical protein EDD11_008178 [Mortierella claussenii]
MHILLDQQYIAKSASTSASSRGGEPDLSSSTASIQSSSGTPVGSLRTSQALKPELAFSTATAFHVSLHGMVEFLEQLVKAFERYLLNKNSNAGPAAGGGAGTRKSSMVSKPNGSATATASISSPTPRLSAKLVQLNTGLVYEIVDECMEHGYALMPSLAQLDLLVFGTPRTS